MRIAVFAAVCSSLLVFGSAGAAPAAATRIVTNIPPQALSSALKQFAQFRDMQVLYFSASVKDLRTRGASGALTANETLNRLLSGTGLTYRYVDQNAVTLLPVNASARQPAAPQSTTGGKEGKSDSSGRFRVAQTAGTPNASPAAVGAAPAPAGSLQEPVLQTVVVTAEKQSQNAQSVPVSLTVLTGAAIQQQGLTNVADLGQVVPGVSVQRTGPGENTVIMRGVSSQAGVASTVGYYYGEVPISQARQIDVPLFDLARIEVLRGPQGSLYGSSSMGGTINYVPNQPEFDHFTETLDVGTEHIDDSSGLGHKVNAVLNIPLVDDELAARILLFSQYDRGYIDRYLIDPNNYLLADTSVPPYRDVNSYDWYGYQIELKYEPWKNVTILPLFLSQKSESQGLFTVDLPEDDLGADQLIQIRDNPEPHDYDANIANLTVDASFGAVNLVSSTSYFTQDITEIEDSSKTQYVLLGLKPPDPVEPITVGTYFQPRELVEELRLSARVGAFDGTIGLYYDRLKTHNTQNIPFSPQWITAYGNPAAFFGNPFPEDNTIFYGAGTSGNTERAIFGQGTYRVTDKLSATLGLRASYYDLSGTNMGYGLANGPPTYFAAHATSHGISPKYNLAYDVTPDTMVYATVAKGLRTGAIQAPAPQACDADLAQYRLAKSPDQYLPDSLWSYEIGAKTMEFDRRMTLNGAVYYIDWSDVQQEVALECGFPFVGNLGKAGVKGGELELDWVPIGRLKLSSSLGYTDAKLENTTPGTPGVAGEPLLLVPLWTASASGEYRQPINANLNGFVRLEASYEDKVYRDFVPTDFFRVAPAYHLANLRFGVQRADDGWEITGYVTNLLNTFAQAGLRLSDTGADLPDTRPVAIVQPRTFGLETVLRWGQ